MRTGVRLILETLEQLAVRRSEMLGRRFDPNVHDAIIESEAPGQLPGIVTRVVEEGYVIHQRLLRPARLIVSERPAPGMAARHPWQRWARGGELTPGSRG